MARLDHFNLATPDVPAARKYYEGLDGKPQPFVVRTEAREADVTIGARGFSYTTKEEREFKLGEQV